MQARGLTEHPACLNCGHTPTPGAKFCSECGVSLQAAAAPPRRVRSLPMVSRAERRQLTVMFCDLVGSTELSSRMDPEELGELLGRYRALVQGEVEALGGTTARFLGDGVLVFFGYPLAGEDDAVRAVRAALAIVRGMQALVERPGKRPSRALQVHLGVHTGMVLIDRLPGGGVGDIIGETPNLAAKVEERAPPGTVLVSAATQALTAEAFEYAPWGPLELGGAATPMALFRVIGERDRRREDGIGRGHGKQFFGRAQETARLARLWRDARGAEGGRVASIVGDPGIGKTRLTQWAADHAEASGGMVIRFYCAQEAADTAFWPVLETIALLCRLTGQTAATQARRLHRVAARLGLPPERFVPAIADLLSIPIDPSVAATHSVAATAEGRRQRLVELLLAWVASLAAEAPLLLVVENVHWMDPSSHALLAELARRAPGLRLLLLVTSRPGPETVLPGIAAVERMALDRLPSHDLEAMLTALWRDAILPGEMQRLLLDKCDGVPLFLEQLVKTVAERASGGGGARLPDVPTSLRDMLAARLDRLGSAKMVALAASVIGRMFTARLLRALLPRRAQGIDAALALLVRADILVPAGGGSDPSFRFRHALLRDAAYDSLLRSERAKYHRTLARAYRRHYAPLVEAQPELVARHASAAGDFKDSLDHWWKAGLRARARSANREATAHFRAGIADAERIEDIAESRAQVIRFTMATSRAAFAAEGFASPEVERLNRRALDLVELSGSKHLLPEALGAMFSHYQVRGPLRLAMASATRLQSLHDGLKDPVAIARTARRVGWCLFCSGQIDAGVAAMSKALDNVTRAVPVKGAALSYGDVRVLGLANLGWALSFAGRLDEAAAHCAAALALARDRYAGMNQQRHDVGSLPGDVAYALCLSAAVAKQMQNAKQVVTFANEAHEFSSKHDLPYWTAWATVLLGWGRAHDDGDHGLGLIVDGIAAYKATGARLFESYNLALLAEAYLAFGRVTDGLLRVSEALEASKEIDAHFMDSELLRIKARLVAQTGNTELALATLGQSIALADRHGAITIRHWAERDRQILLEGRNGRPGGPAKPAAGRIDFVMRQI
jgi:class 3 adenylate cyclase/tetratricopeptide (TPR) repeat protein